MSSESNVRVRNLGDPLALRALAHPLRFKLLGVVGRAGTLTAAEAARELGISHALASHHLRQLAKYGFVEAADTTDDRARPWRVTATSMHFDPSDPEAWPPNDLIQNHLVQEAARNLLDWQRRRGGEDARWSDLSGAFDSLLYLEPGELREVLEAWQATLAPFIAARPLGYADRRPADAVPVSLTLIAIPLPRTAHGG